VAHAFNLGYLGRGDQEDLGSRPTGQKVSKTLISTNKPSAVVHAYTIPATQGGTGNGIMVQASPRQKNVRPYLKNS
jgi:hypothetical protein